MIKKIFLIAAIFAVCSVDVNAACVESDKVYTACKAGYYLSDGNCLPCPLLGDVYGTSADKNTVGITACCLPSNTVAEDETGNFTIESANCCWVN